MSLESLFFLVLRYHLLCVTSLRLCTLRQCDVSFVGEQANFTRTRVPNPVFSEALRGNSDTPITRFLFLDILGESDDWADVQKIKTASLSIKNIFLAYKILRKRNCAGWGVIYGATARRVIEMRFADIIFSGHWFQGCASSFLMRDMCLPCDSV